MKKLSVILILFLTGLSGLLAQKVTFNISTPNSTAEGSQIQVRYILKIEGKSGNPTSPHVDENAFSGFEVIYGPALSSSSTSTTIINGNMSSQKELTYTYTLIAKKQGTFTIPAATIEVEGKTYKSNTAQIKVLPPDKDAQAEQQGGRPRKEIKSTSTSKNISAKDAFIRAIFSKKKVTEQEAVTVTFRLYTVLNIPQLNKIEFPEFEGFMTEDFDLPNYTQGRLENYNGKNYVVYDLRKCLLFPQRSGAITIPSGKLGVVMTVPTGEVYNHPFFGPQELNEDVQRTLKTSPETVNVSSLPRENKPMGFSGAVGTFSLMPTISETDVKANEAITLKLIISGTGNLKLIKNPEVKFPSEMETYDPKVSNDFRVTESGLSGTRTIEYMFIPRYPGTYTIPSVYFSYFDVNQKQFKTISTPPYTINVAKDPSTKNNNGTSYSNQRSVEVEQDIHYLKTGDYKFKKTDNFFFGSLANVLWYLIPLVLFIGCSVYYRKQIKANANVALVRTKKANKVASKRLKLANKYLAVHDKDHFYEEVLRAVWGYLSDKLTIPVANLNRENIEIELLKYGMNDHLIKQYIAILDTCEFARYAPSESDAAMDSVYNDTVEAIGKMENFIKKR